ncbi:hypothetical protein GJAV_G00252020 [Gymnothorax javanicus]|nr:hypothetical protein GJAV_G00252020 [Gymnothorax javanicus]
MQDHARLERMDSTASMEFASHYGGGKGMRGIRLYKLIAFCLGLLCVLLLIVSIAVCAHYNREASNTSETLKVMKAERDQLLTNYSTVTAERDQLLTNYSTVTTERDQLLTNYAAKKNWWESRLFCINKGADLVIIDNLEEQVFLNGLMRTKHFWIGLSDTVKEKKWEWVDGTELTSGFWKRGEPNDADAEEDCASSEPETNPNKNWNDLPCRSTRNWICERSVCQ